MLGQTVPSIDNSVAKKVLSDIGATILFEYFEGMTPSASCIQLEKFGVATLIFTVNIFVNFS